MLRAFFVGNKIMAKQSSMIRDLVINVKSNDLAKTATEAEKLVSALVDAAEGGEMLKAEFNSVKTSLLSVNKAANTTLGIFNNFALNEKFKSSLNQVLEGVNRISAASKNLKGLDIGISLKVDNLTQLQQQVSKSIQGLDISINIKAGNLNSTNDRMQALVSNMQDAAAGVELLNSQLATTKTMVSSIKTDADAAAYSLAKVAISKNLENGLDDVVHALNMISEEIVQLNMDSKDSFADMTNAIDHMDDSLGAVNKTLHQTKFATKEVGTNTRNIVDGFNKTGKSSDDMGKKVANATHGMRNQSRVMGDLAKIAGPLPAAYAMIAANVWALTSAFEYLASGDQLNRLENIGTTIGANIGLPVQKLARDMVEVTNGAISYESALRKAANASGYGFSSDELSKMTEVARRAAVVMGVDMDDALNRIIKGVSKQEIELLDELGITVRLTEAQSNYAKSLNISTDSLTSNQKQSAYLQAVLKQSEKSFGYLSSSDLGATNVEKLGAAVSSLVSRFSQLLAKGANWTLDGMFPETKTADEVNKVVKSMGSMVSSIEKAKKLGKIDSVITLSKDAVSGYDNLSIKMKELETVIEDGGYSVETLNGKILGTTQNFIATKDQIKAAKQAMQEYVSVFEEYVVVQQQQDMILRSVVADLGYIGLSTSKQQELVAKFSETIGNIHSTAKSAGDGVNSFRSSLLKQQEPINMYVTSLNDILNAYSQIDKLEVQFPSVPDSVIARLREMVRLSAEAATGIHSRTGVNTAKDRAKALQDFTTNTINKEGITGAETNLSSMGGISGEAELKTQKQILANRQEELRLGEKGTGAAKEDLISAERRKQISLDIANATLAIAQAEQGLALTKQGMLEQDSRRNNLFMQYSKMSDAGYQAAALKNELTDRENLLETQKRYNVNQEIQYQTETDIQETKFKINAATVANNIAQIEYNQSLREGEAAGNTFLAYMSGIPIEITQATLAQHELNAALAKSKEIESAFNKGDSGVKAEQVAAAKTAVQQAKLAEMKAAEAAIEAEANRDSLNLQIQTANLNLGELEVAKNQEIIEAKHLQNLKDAHASQTAILNQTLAEAEARRKITDIENERHRAAVEGGIGAIQGENQAQYTSTTGMDTEAAKLASNSDKLANVTNSFDQLASYDQPFANVAANLSQMAIAIQDNAGAMEIASMAGQTITSMFQMNGQAAVDAIDAQIAAEKKRDGTSEESLAKIKALEAKKIETTRKTARQTIIMQTAVGVANALAMGNPMIGIPMAIAVGAMGLQALKAADSAAESSLAGLDSSATTGSLTLGDRANKVDTAQTANSGELSYIQGATGTGGIQTFTPRASAGSANAGYSYIVGEKGPELITPKIDSVVSDAQTTRNAGSASIGGITLNVNAIDARSFQDLVYANPQIFKDAVEMTLNQQGKTLG